MLEILKKCLVPLEAIVTTESDMTELVSLNYSASSNISCDAVLYNILWILFFKVLLNKDLDPLYSDLQEASQ